MKINDKVQYENTTATIKDIDEDGLIELEFSDDEYQKLNWQDDTFKDSLWITKDEIQNLEGVK